MQEMTAHVTLKIPTGDSTKTLFTDFVLGADCSITQCDGPFVRTHMLNDFNRFMEEHNLWDKQDIEVWSFIFQDIAPHDLQKWLCKPQSLTPKGKIRSLYEYRPCANRQTLHTFPIEYLQL